MIEGLFWYLVAIFLVLPAAVGMYLMFASRDNLVVRYQNFVLGRTTRPLKDEDFLGIYRMIAAVRVLGALLVSLSAFGVYLLVS